MHELREGAKRLREFIACPVIRPKLSGKGFLGWVHLKEGGHEQTDHHDDNPGIVS